jgi:predicted esterase YcpF (UPF0227 family)
MIVYLHGFMSSPASLKARALAEYLNERRQRLVVPEIPPDPRMAIKVIEDAIASGSCTALIGSSLGGYYATHFAEKHGTRVVLVNPAVRPYELLKHYLGPQRSLYTGEEFTVTQEHLDGLRELDVPLITRPDRYLVLLETGDEVLDYREAIAKYQGARQIVIEGGDHSFQSFAQYIPHIFEFAVI